MPIVHYLESLEAVAVNSSTREQFSLSWRDFLDGFSMKPEASKLATKPALLRDVLDDGGYADAFLGAMAEHLTQQHRMPVPAWCLEANRFLDEPVFAFKTAEGRMFLLVESPTAFRRRNIFISGDALTRV